MDSVGFDFSRQGIYSIQSVGPLCPLQETVSATRLSAFLPGRDLSGKSWGKTWESNFSLSDPHPCPLFWHSFWHFLWKYLWHTDAYSIYSDILSGIYFDILSDILSGILCGIYWHANSTAWALVTRRCDGTGGSRTSGRARIPLLSCVWWATLGMSQPGGCIYNQLPCNGDHGDRPAGSNFIFFGQTTLRKNEKAKHYWFIFPFFIFSQVENWNRLQ